MTVFIHTGDWQIGKPYGKVSDPAKRVQLQRARIEAIGRIRETVLAHQAARVLVAGDLFDAEILPTNTLLEVLQSIGELKVPVLVIPGNHDHGAPGTLWHQDDFQRHRQALAPNLRVLLQRQPIELDDLVLLPCPLLRRHEAIDPTAWLRELDWSALPAQKPRVLLAHGGVHGFGGEVYADTDDADYNTNRIELARLPAGQLDYIALGDWHNLKQVASHGAPAEAWYAGTPEPDRFDRGEDNQRAQVLVVSLTRGQPPKVEAHPTGRLRWHRLEMHFASDSDLERFEQRLDEHIGAGVNRDLLPCRSVAN